MTKRTIHCDVMGTLDGRNGKLLFNFLVDADKNGHEVKAVSGLGDFMDDGILKDFTDSARFLLPTIRKRDLDDAVESGKKSKQHDILIDDDPFIDPENQEFTDFTNIWVDPNSPTLLDDLKSLSQEKLGFKFTPTS